MTVLSRDKTEVSRGGGRRWKGKFCLVFQWFDLDVPESATFPMSYGKLRGFQRLMLLRCFRVDRIYRAVSEYVSRVMGEKYVMPPVISFESIFERSTPLCPIVFILSPGSDPASDLMKLADRLGFGAGKLKYLSLGQGQEKVGVGFEMFYIGPTDSYINIANFSTSPLSAI